ncbi:MAG: PAS domain S-box protein [Candidatus Aminicenantes bacterium]|nr:PAS domain S-box protein [Candidatus Aminicenantes bacterium]
MAKKKEKTRPPLNRIDAIADRVAITDLQGRIIDVNQAMLIFHNRRRDEIIGRNFLDMVLEEDRDMIRQCFTDTIERGFSNTVEYRSLNSSGEVVYSEVNALTIRDASGHPFEAVAVIRDVSHRKAVESRLAESEEMYRNLIENIREAVYKIDENGLIRFISSGIERISGYKPNELVGAHFSDFIFRDDLSHIQEQFAKLMKSILESDEYRIICKNGEIRWISSSSRPVFANGKFIGIHGILTDIHERKIAQQALQSQQELLQQAQKMEAIGTLASGIAHDFNNLLMGIQGRASLLLMESDCSRPEYGHLKGIEQYIKSAAELTQQLLGLARGGKYEVVPTDLNALVQNSIDIFGRTKKEIKIFTMLDPELRVVEVDRTQIEQVLLNLLVNAWQAMPEGGDISVTTQNVDLREGDARIFQLQSGHFVRLGVSDSGIGMDESTKSRIFDPFFTTKEMGRGTGLGLASAYGIVKNHGGIITVYSEKDSGSIFHVYLPASEKNVETINETVAQVPGGSETILLIDDEDMILDVARQMLLSLGYRVLTANSGGPALGIFRKNHAHIDLVILDMIMPLMSGSKVFEGLKGIDPAVRVLLSSGYSINGQAMDILARGCRGFIQKPFTLMELALKIREVLNA